MTSSPPNPSAKTIYRRMLQQILPYKRWLLLGILGTLTYAGMEASLIFLVKYLINNVLNDRTSLITMGLPVMIISIFTIRGSANFISAYSLARVSGYLIHNLRNDIYHRYLHMPARAYDQTNTGSLLSKLLYNTTQMTHACTTSVLDLISNVATVLFLVITLFILDWHLSLFFISNRALNWTLFTYFK